MTFDISRLARPDSMLSETFSSLWKKSLAGIVVLMVSPLASANWLGFGGCSDAEDIPKPEWVSLGHEYQQSGYRYGYGQARAQEGYEYQKLLKEAEANARNDLASSVQVTIKSKFGVRQLVEQEGSSESVQRSSEGYTETSSYIKLPGLPIEKQWQDPENCNMHVLVKIAEPVLALVLKKSQVDVFYSDAQEENKTFKIRQIAIESAIEMVQQHDFRKIPGSKSSAQLLKEFKHYQEQLVNMSAKENHAVFVINQTEDTNASALKPLMDNLISTMPGSFNVNKKCTSPTLCLNLANDTQANYASFANVKMDVVNQNGFWVGSFSVELSLMDLSNNTVKYKSGELQTRVMNRHKHKLNLKSSYAKWLKVHENKLNEYKTFASSIK